MAWKNYCAEYWLKELQESMDRCTGCHDITEILLKTALNTIQSFNLTTLKKNGFENIVRIGENAMFSTYEKQIMSF